ncbi:cyclodeaminase/cyclohydrolase family protein [Atopobium fossor]|uniref:cyclodeaminase/cyclohydrolase family protein n=1 Tax=Atopobium fossor TaxID=39487 RepID=UPI0004023310|nr:cyclodeaminase/cyclohydrolase family protein [Atopobium fossor]
MITHVTNLRCTDYVRAVASKQSIPGGGSVTALVGALGASLGCMAANFTKGKSAFVQHEDRLSELIAQLENLAAELMLQVDYDAKSVEELACAWALPQSDPMREERIQLATFDATKAPLAMMRALVQTLVLLEELVDICSKLLLSDVGTGALLCETALQAAALNVFVNTNCLVDVQQREQLESECDEILKRWLPRAQELAKNVCEQIRHSR